MIMIGIGIAAIIFTSGNNIEKTESEKPLVLSMTASVEIPEKMTFAGEKIVFDRYDLHERMDREINTFTYFHSTTMLMIKRANRIFPIIEPILKRNGIPEDMKYLAVIESSLDSRAVSPAHAAGLWQFMIGTARTFGMEISGDVDERYNIEKSTIAACRYLKQAYQKYGSWAAAALSYNGGQGRISSELRDQRVSDATDLWLVDETMRYYFRMLAAKTVFEHPRLYGFIILPSQLYKPIDFREVKIASSIPDLTAFAKQHNTSYAVLKDFNSWLRSDKLSNRNNKAYKILIPMKESLFYEKSKKPKVHDLRWVSP